MMARYQDRHRELFLPDGATHRGSGLALHFWNGFDGVSMGGGFKSRSERQSPAYASWRAGQDCKARQMSQEA